jgi:hypothetical protein
MASSREVERAGSEFWWRYESVAMATVTYGRWSRATTAVTIRSFRAAPTTYTSRSVSMRIPGTSARSTSTFTYSMCCSLRGNELAREATERTLLAERVRHDVIDVTDERRLGRLPLIVDHARSHDRLPQRWVAPQFPVLHDPVRQRPNANRVECLTLRLTEISQVRRPPPAQRTRGPPWAGCPWAAAALSGGQNPSLLISYDRRGACKRVDPARCLVWVLGRPTRFRAMLRL